MRAHTLRRLVPSAALALVLVASTGLIAPAPAGAHEDSRHQVARGDTLSEIALRLGLDTEDLAEANGISDPDLVISGRYLTVPADANGITATGAGAAGTHEVARGETLSGIAVDHGLSAYALAAANGLADPHLVVAGTTLTIPAAGASSASTSSSGSSELPERLREVPERLALIGTFDDWAATYGVPADLLKATTWLESGWQNDVVSRDGAIGIGQLLPVTVETVEDLLATDINPWSTNDNIRASARYLEFLLDAAGGDTGTALAYYYQGPGSVERNGLYGQTIAYVNGVSALRARF